MTEKIPVSAIICEFDPLHFGHKLLLDTAWKAGGAVCCIISGNFVQRGTPSMLDKWSRARLALQNGADLVAELPLSWACAGAERFASGGVALATALGADRLWFGSECPDSQKLSLLAEALLSPAFHQELASQSRPGESFAQRRQRAAAQLLGPDTASLLAFPNANLGVEYIKAIRRQNAPILPCPILRQGAGHGESLPIPFQQKAEDIPLLSGSQLRERAIRGHSLAGLVPESTAAEIESAAAQGSFPAKMEYLERAILCVLRSIPKEEFPSLPDISEGLEHRLYKAVQQARSLEELFAQIKSKRYSHARIRRLVLSGFLGIRAPLQELPPYLRILGVTQRGLQVLKQLSSGLPVITRASDLRKLGQKAHAVFQNEVQADNLYVLACPLPQRAGQDFTRPLIRLP